MCHKTWLVNWQAKRFMLVLALSFYSVISLLYLYLLKCRHYTIYSTSLDYCKVKTLKPIKYYKYHVLLLFLLSEKIKLGTSNSSSQPEEVSLTSYMFQECGYRSFAILILSAYPMNKRLFDQCSMLFVKFLKG